MEPKQEYAYVGSELELFMLASNWKKYWSSRLRPFVSGAVLDVGAGLGATFEYLHDAARTWTCLEPDASLCARIEQRLSAHPNAPRVVHGTLNALDVGSRFDTIVYIDVLEHIEHDREELTSAAGHLAPGGSLVVLSPALPFLYSRFDEKVGHFRRYTPGSLRRVAPDDVAVRSWFFLDGLGVLASLFARFARRGDPSPRQIEAWDKVLLPASRVTDALTSRWFGRSIVMVWTKQ